MYNDDSKNPQGWEGAGYQVPCHVYCESLLRVALLVMVLLAMTEKGAAVRHRQLCPQFQQPRLHAVSLCWLGWCGS